jgi:hypothetical protein
MGVFSQTVTVNGRCISFDAYLALTLTSQRALALTLTLYERNGEALKNRAVTRPGKYSFDFTF